MNRGPHLLPDLVAVAAARAPRAVALVDGARRVDYGELWRQIEGCAGGLAALGLGRFARVAVYLEKRVEAVVACFGAAHAGATFVPVNPVLKAEQVAHILRDCGVRVLVTSRQRLDALAATLSTCPDLSHVVIVDGEGAAAGVGALVRHDWSAFLAAEIARGVAAPAATEADMVAIFYTSGSTGKPKGVVLSHRNLVAGAQSVAGYLDNRADDVLLGVLPLSFDAGFSQLTTAFHAGARVVLLNYLLPRDVLLAMARERVSGLTAVPPLYIQLARLDWPAGCADTLRYFANTGGRMPQDTLARLRQRAPQARPYLMYGLTEAFRSTYLPPEEIDRRPESIGKAIPNAEVLVLRADGTPCAAGEAGELVHRGPLVSLGYWNNPEATAERFKPLPPGLRPDGLLLPEIAVFSGDTVCADAAGFLTFVGRRDEMIKTSGYRVSPTEVEEVLYASGLVGECVAFGMPDEVLGQVIHVIATPVPGTPADVEALFSACRQRMPAYLVPAAIEMRDGPLPRSPNGKLDRKTLHDDATKKAGEGT